MIMINLDDILVKQWDIAMEYFYTNYVLWRITNQSFKEIIEAEYYDLRRKTNRTTCKVC